MLEEGKKAISSQTKAILNKTGVVLKKSLGQNFLTDRHALEKIADAVVLTKHSGVIEIGPGIGALTEKLAERAGKIVAVELDQRLLPVLNDLFANQPQVQFTHGDALQIDFHQLIEEHLKGCEDVHIIANLPYYITSPIITRLLSERYPIQNLVIMIQKEVADRLLASPNTKAYGSLTLFVQYYAQVEKVAVVSRKVFVPQPKVDSTVVRLNIRSHPPVEVPDENKLFQVIRAAFGKRRKTLLNALSTHFSSEKSKTEWSDLLYQVDIDPTRRGETLSLEEFARIVVAIES